MIVNFYDFVIDLYKTIHRPKKEISYFLLQLKEYGTQYNCLTPSIFHSVIRPNKHHFTPTNMFHKNAFL